MRAALAVVRGSGLHNEPPRGKVRGIGHQLSGEAVHDHFGGQELAESVLLGAQQLADFAEPLVAGAGGVFLNELHGRALLFKLVSLQLDLLGLVSGEAQGLGKSLWYLMVLLLPLQLAPARYDLAAKWNAIPC